MSMKPATRENIKFSETVHNDQERNLQTETDLRRLMMIVDYE